MGGEISSVTLQKWLITNHFSLVQQRPCWRQSKPKCKAKPCHIYTDGITPDDLQTENMSLIHLADKLLLHNMAASSGLRENVYPIKFSLKMCIFIILLILLLISIDVKSYQLLLLLFRYRC